MEKVEMLSNIHERILETMHSEDLKYNKALFLPNLVIEYLKLIREMNIDNNSFSFIEKIRIDPETRIPYYEDNGLIRDYPNEASKHIRLCSSR